MSRTVVAVLDALGALAIAAGVSVLLYPFMGFACTIGGGIILLASARLIERGARDEEGAET